MVARLGVAGVLGAILGAWVLSNVEVTAVRRFVYAYLLIMEFYILWKSMRVAPAPRSPAGWTSVLGFGAGFLDATGGGRLGTDDSINARRVRACAALLRRQYG
jgi:hypothetical protein